MTVRTNMDELFAAEEIWITSVPQQFELLQAWALQVKQCLSDPNDLPIREYFAESGATDAVIMALAETIFRFVSTYAGKTSNRTEYVTRRADHVEKLTDEDIENHLATPDLVVKIALGALSTPEESALLECYCMVMAGHALRAKTEIKIPVADKLSEEQKEVCLKLLSHAGKFYFHDHGLEVEKLEREPLLPVNTSWKYHGVRHVQQIIWAVICLVCSTLSGNRFMNANPTKFELNLIRVPQLLGAAHLFALSLLWREQHIRLLFRQNPALTELKTKIASAVEGISQFLV